MPNQPCRVCGKSPDDRPSIFKNEEWCSDNHRKMILGEIPWV